MHVIKSKNIGKYSCQFNFVSTKVRERGIGCYPVLAQTLEAWGKKSLLHQKY